MGQLIDEKYTHNTHNDIIRQVLESGDGNFAPSFETIGIMSALVVRLKWKKIHIIKINEKIYDIYNLNNVYMVGVFANTDTDKEIFEIFLRLSSDRHRNSKYINFELYQEVHKYLISKGNINE